VLLLSMLCCQEERGDAQSNGDDHDECC
jgi:hypothetical protein